MNKRIIILISLIFAQHTTIFSVWSDQEPVIEDGGSVTFTPALKKGWFSDTVNSYQMEVNRKALFDSNRKEKLADKKELIDDFNSCVKQLCLNNQRAYVKTWINGLMAFGCGSLVLGSYYKKAAGSSSIPFVAREYIPHFYKVADNLCEKLGLQNPRIHIMNLPLYSAWTTASRDELSIYITQDAINNFTADEFEAVVAHELAHSFHNDAKERDFLTMLLGVATFFVLNECLYQYSYPSIANYFAKANYTTTAGALNYAKIAGIIGLSSGVAKILNLPADIYAAEKIRAQEKEADIWGAKISKKPLALVSALEKIELFNKEYTKKNTNFLSRLEVLVPQKLQDLLASHPKTEERVAYLKEWAIAHNCTQ